MSIATKSLAIAALAGLVGAGAYMPTAHAATSNGQTYTVADASSDQAPVYKEKHACKGQNSCKGLGKDGKNSCKGQGSCATDGSK